MLKVIPKATVDQAQQLTVAQKQSYKMISQSHIKLQKHFEKRLKRLDDRHKE